MRHIATLPIFLLLTACNSADPNARETVGEKSEWSVLQSIEFSERGKLKAQPALFSIQSYDLLVVPGLEKQNIWIMLNPTSPPYYKQMPEGQFSLPRSYVEQLIRQKKLGYTVEQVLLSSASKK